ncbi:MAG: DNA-formamidopyrimidine glycosylase family protein [Balneolaceae bacterium]|nr:DNA-formamidopyrimidine glycosylase family protein [Balneolaceae bacterium]
MPELPELANFKKYIDSTSLHQTVDKVVVTDDRILNNTTGNELLDTLKGRQFISTLQHGKYLFLQTDNHLELMLHFGMTGNPVYYKNEEEKPDYARVIFQFDNGYHLAYNCMRMLGEVQLIEDHNEFIRQKELGPDAMSGEIDLERFKELVRSSRGMIKTTLMDQGLMAGIGNECSEEILYQSGIHPKTKIKELSDDQLKTVYEQLHYVVETKTEAGTGLEGLPDHWILKHREDGAECPKCGGTINRIEVGGRGTYICPECQG